MPTYSNMTLLELKRHLNELNLMLEEKAPELVAEIRLIRSFIEQKEKGSAEPRVLYHDVRFPKDAVEAALQHNGDFVLNKEEIVSHIVDGGYTHRGKSSPRAIINVTINSYLAKGYLIDREGKIGRNPHPPKAN
jgi:hypothetical protein